MVEYSQSSVSDAEAEGRGGLERRNICNDLQRLCGSIIIHGVVCLPAIGGVRAVSTKLNDTANYASLHPLLHTHSYSITVGGYHLNRNGTLESSSLLLSMYIVQLEGATVDKWYSFVKVTKGYICAGSRKAT